MEDLIKEQTEKSPEIIFKTDGTLIMRGISVLENTHEFYNGVFDWLDLLLRNPPASVKLLFDIEYLNTSSTKICINLAKKVASFGGLGSSVAVTWRYQEEDEDIYELGKEVEYFSNIEFTFEAYS